MRLYRNAIILLVVVGLLVGAYVILANKKGSSEDPAGESTETVKIVEMDKEKIKEISVENKDGKFAFVKVEKEKDVDKGDGTTEKQKVKEWTISSPADLKIDPSKIDSIESNISSLDANRVIEENATDLAQYGLDKPVVVSAKLEDGTVKTVELGNKTPTEDGYYLKVKDSNKVYTISSYIGDIFKAEKNEIRDKALFAIKPEDIQNVAMERNGSIVFSAKKTKDGENESWQLTEPIKANANLEGLTPVVNAFSAMNILNFIEENAADLDKYGLKNPVYTLTVDTAAGKSKLLLGQEKVKGSEIYAKLENSNEVFTVDLSALNFLDKPLKEIVEVFAYITNIADVDKIRVEMDGQVINCELKQDPGGDTEKDKFYVNGKDATIVDENDNNLFRKFYQGLIGITLSDIEMGADITGKKPEISFTYYRKKDPKEVRVDFVPKDENYYYVVKNGEYSNIIVAKSKFDAPDGPRETYKILKEAMDKQK